MIFLGIGRKLTKLLSLGLLAVVLYGGNVTSVFATEFSASFKNADINEFINIVGKNLQKTIILDPAVRGNINVRSYNQLNEKQYYQFFLNVLEVYGFAIIEMDNGIIKVIKAKDAKVSGVPVVDADSPLANDEMITKVVPLKNASARELAPLLRKLNDSAGGGNVISYNPSNVIMLTGRAAVINRLVDIIERIDNSDDEEADIIELKYSNPTDMIELVESVQESQSSSNKKSTTTSMLKPHLVADERTNSLIITGDEKARASAIKLIKSLDTEVRHNNNNIRVFYLQYATASEVVKVLKGISGSIQNTQSSSASQGKSSSKKSSSSQSNLSIESHEGTNSIIISAQPEIMNSLSSIITQLDIRRAQVLVEAIIVEVSEDDGIGLNSQIASSYGGSSFSDNGVSSANLVAAAVSVDEDDDYDSAIDALSSISGGILGVGGDDWAWIFQAVSTSSTANILSTPSITTLDNQEASFIVGDEVPVITGTSASSEDTFSTVEREDVGIKLKVTPQINKGNTVKMVIEQEVSSIQGSTTVDIIFATRAIKTTVLAKSGATVILGGLIGEEVSESVEKIPFLGDLPLIGWLFRSTISSTEKSNLMIFLRATILRDDESMGVLSRRKYQLIREIQQGQRENGINLMPNSDAPILPEWGHSHEINPDDFTSVKNSKKAEFKLEEEEQ